MNEMANLLNLPFEFLPFEHKISSICTEDVMDREACNTPNVRNEMNYIDKLSVDFCFLPKSLINKIHFLLVD